MTRDIKNYQHNAFDIDILNINEHDNIIGDLQRNRIRLRRRRIRYGRCNRRRRCCWCRRNRRNHDRIRNHNSVRSLITNEGFYIIYNEQSYYNELLQSKIISFTINIDMYIVT